MDILLVVVGIIGLVWGAVLFLRGGLLGGCLAVLLAGSCLGSPFFSLPLEPMPLTVDRLLWAALLVQYAVWRRLGRADPKPLGTPEYLLLAFIGVLLVSTFSHDWHTHQSQPLSRLVFYYLMPLGIYWVARQSVISERGILALFGVLAVFGIYLAVTAIAETHQLWWMVFPKYIASTDNPSFFGRGRGPLLNPSGCGFFQGVCLCCALAWWPRLDRAGRLALLAVSLLFCLGVYSTLTRTAWMGAAAGLFVFVGLSLPRTWRLPVLGGSLLVGTLVVAGNWDRIMTLKRDQGVSARESAESVALRPILATVAWHMFLDRPLAGCGFGHYRDEAGNYLADRSTAMPLEKARPYHQHNVFLALLTETGLLGMGLFLALLVLWTRDAWRLWHTPSAPFWARQQGLVFLALMGNYCANAMFQDVSIIPMVNMLLFFAAGLTAGLRPFARPVAKPAPAPSGRAMTSASPSLPPQPVT